jgi:hypothetical protein
MTVLKEHTEKLKLLLCEINNCTIVQSYISDICTQLETLLFRFAICNAYTRNNNVEYINCDDNTQIIHPDSRIYALFMQYILAAGVKYKKGFFPLCLDKRSTQTIQILHQGNIREKCSVFCRIMTNDPKYTLLNWLLCIPIYEVPSNINVDVISNMKSTIPACLLSSPRFEIRMNESRLLLKQTMHAESLSRFMAKNAHATRNCDRFVRSVETRDSYRLHCLDVIPSLSEREYADLPKPLSLDGLLPLQTGQMKWDIKKNSTFLKNATIHGRDVVAGISGHTEYLHNFMAFFKSYDVRITTLLCCVWLVPFKHHSVYEILMTSSFYGIEYKMQMDPIDFLVDLFQDIQNSAKPVP